MHRAWAPWADLQPGHHHGGGAHPRVTILTKSPNAGETEGWAHTRPAPGSPAGPQEMEDSTELPGGIRLGLAIPAITASRVSFVPFSREGQCMLKGVRSLRLIVLTLPSSPQAGPWGASLSGSEQGGPFQAPPKGLARHPGPKGPLTTSWGQALAQRPGPAPCWFPHPSLTSTCQCHLSLRPYSR